MGRCCNELELSPTNSLSLADLFTGSITLPTSDDSSLLTKEVIRRFLLFGFARVLFSILATNFKENSPILSLIRLRLGCAGVRKMIVVFVTVIVVGVFTGCTKNSSTLGLWLPALSKTSNLGSTSSASSYSLIMITLRPPNEQLRLGQASYMSMQPIFLLPLSTTVWGETDD